jgi:hypothetical protein
MTTGAAADRAAPFEPPPRVGRPAPTTSVARCPTTCRSAVNAKVAFERSTAARSRARQRAASRHTPTITRTGVAFGRCNGGLDTATNATGSAPKSPHACTRSGSDSRVRLRGRSKCSRRTLRMSPLHRTRRTSPTSPSHDDYGRRCRPHRPNRTGTSRWPPFAHNFRRSLSNDLAVQMR